MQGEAAAEMQREYYHEERELQLSRDYASVMKIEKKYPVYKTLSLNNLDEGLNRKRAIKYFYDWLLFS